MIFNRDIIGNGDIYGNKFSYDEMIAMGNVTHFSYKQDQVLDFEDLVIIAETIYAHWVDGRDSTEDEKYEMYPWLEFENAEEEHYMSTYSYRVSPKFIELFIKEYYKND